MASSGQTTREKSIEAAVTTAPDYQMANQEYIERKYEHDIATGVVRAFDHRKAALENLVRLHANQYFAGPSVPA